MVELVVVFHKLLCQLMVCVHRVKDILQVAVVVEQMEMPLLHHLMVKVDLVAVEEVVYILVVSVLEQRNQEQLILVVAVVEQDQVERVLVLVDQEL
jgi:hypothetical protein